MLPYRDSRLAKIALAAFFIIVIFYAYYEARGLLFGPTISASSEITVSRERFITIRGKAERISELSMNGKPVPVTEEGAFDEPYLLTNGYNRIFLRARDKYGRTSEKVVEVMYEPAPASITPASASSSVSTSTMAQ